MLDWNSVEVYARYRESQYRAEAERERLLRQATDARRPERTVRPPQGEGRGNLLSRLAARLWVRFPRPLRA